MNTNEASVSPQFGSKDLRLPDELRAPLRAHLSALHERYLARNWGLRVGMGKRPAVIVIDLANFWLRPDEQMGSNLDSVLENTCHVLAAARAAEMPVFFTTFNYDPSHPSSPHDLKMKTTLRADAATLFQLDSRLERRPNEKVIYKRYASAFKGTNLHEMLTGLGIDTLIVTGVSTSHCVYATCRDATDSFRVIVPREAVGERCELMHEVFLFDIDVDLADVMPVDEVIGQMKKIAAK
jgi:maleamate amidohydrolase